MKKEIRKGIEESEVFLVIYTENYLENVDCVEQLLYAKSLNKPILILREEGMNDTIPDIFKGCNIIFDGTFDKGNPDISHLAKKIISSLEKEANNH